MYNDTVSDFLTRLRNSAMASKGTASVRWSKMVESIAHVLKQEGFIASFERDGNHLNVVLNPELPIIHLKRLSKPSLRRYVSHIQIPRPRSGLGTVIVSTPKGILTGNQARKQKVGGELIMELW